MNDEIKNQLLKDLSRPGYKFRGPWFEQHGVSKNDGNKLLYELESDNLITFGKYLNGIDYGSVKLV